MADEQNKDMEKILRAYTEARRKGADLPLHPATRKMLQTEVARRFKNGGHEPLWSRVRAFWPQLAFGSGLCAILLVAVISLRHQPVHERQTASPVAATDSELRSESLNENLKKQAPNDRPASQAETLERRDLANVPAPAAPQLSVRAQELDRATREEGQVKMKDGKAVPEQQAKRKTSASLRARVDEARVLQLQEAAPAQATGKETAINPSAYARIDRLTNLGDALRLEFVSVPNRGVQPTGPQLLNSFQLEQQGDDVRITDKDGSVYLGQLFPEPPAQPQNIPSFSAATGRGLGVAENTQGTSVRLLYAQGTNRTLAKQVRLEGRYLERTNPVEAITPTSASAALAAPTARLGRARHSIVGKAVVGQTNEVPLNAVSVEPAR